MQHKTGGQLSPMLERRCAYYSTTAVIAAGDGAVFLVRAGKPADPIGAVKPRDLAGRPRPEAAWEPHPACSRNEIPTAVVVGQPAPGFSADPGVAPARIPAPSAHGVGRPSGGEHVGDPSEALPGHVRPGAVLLEVGPSVIGIVRIA